MLLMKYSLVLKMNLTRCSYFVNTLGLDSYWIKEFISKKRASISEFAFVQFDTKQRFNSDQDLSLCLNNWIRTR